MKKMFIALGIAFALICGFATQSFNAWHADYMAEQEKINQIIEADKADMIARWGEEAYNEGKYTVTGIEDYTSLNADGELVGSYRVNSYWFGVHCSSKVTVDELKLA